MASEKIKQLLKQAGLSEDETNHLLAKFLEEEAIPYIESMAAVKTESK